MNTLRRKDDCGQCSCRGRIADCKSSGCPTFDSWIVKELLREIEELKESHEREIYELDEFYSYYVINGKLI